MANVEYLSFAAVASVAQIFNWDTRPFPIK